MDAAKSPQRLFVVTVSGRLSFYDTVADALGRLAGGERTVYRSPDRKPYPVGLWPEVTAELSEMATRYLDDVLPTAAIELLAVQHLDQLQSTLRQSLTARGDRQYGPLPWNAGVTVLFLVDSASAVPGADPDSRLDTLTEALYGARDEFGVGLSPYSVVVFDQLDGDRVYSRTLCSSRKRPEEDWILAAESIRAFTDLVQARHANTKAVLPETEKPATLATALTTFLTEQAGTQWGFHFFTGSIIAKVIQDVAAIARRAGNPVLRGPNEHSLACGALARWQLRNAPFLIVVTAGMVDELKGTLANLRDSQAQGFIVFGETEPGTWQPFQGTIHTHEDARAVFAAYGVPCFHLADPARLDQDLGAAFRAFHQRKGPVVLLAAPKVLHHTDDLEQPKVTTALTHARTDDDTVDTIARILNDEPCPILWQCGKLTRGERELVYDLARRAGIALVDSLGRPGTVARYRDGHVVPEYLGTLSLYGCSPEVWSFLHPAGKLLPYGEHAVFFVKSRISDLGTPFSEKRLREQVRVVQITDTSSHIAPFTDIPVVEELAPFLRRLATRLAPQGGVVRARYEAIDRARRASGDPLAKVPSVPMSHEYFFTQLNGVLEELITSQGYSYTGFYDVGRGGISAVRNLVRTGPGFSGWYGRALMGDALLAMPSFALSDPGNVLGFIGDGAANLVPSILPSLAQQLRYESGRIDGNVSIFFLLNGGFSIIRSYRELQHAATADAQMSLLSTVAPAWQQTWGDVTIAHERLTMVDSQHLAKRLLEPATVNLFSVYLAHDNEGDNIMPLSRKNWRMTQN